MSEKKLCTIEEVIKEVDKKRSLLKIQYGFFVHLFLPTEGVRGFEDCSIVKCSKKEFIKTAQDLLRHFGDRGAKITLTVPTADFESFLI